MADEKYYIRWKGRRSGPHSADEILGLYDARRISRLYQVSRDDVSWDSVENLIAQLRTSGCNGITRLEDRMGDDSITPSPQSPKYASEPPPLPMVEVTRHFQGVDMPVANDSYQEESLLTSASVSFGLRFGAFMLDALCVFAGIVIISGALVGLMLFARFGNDVIISLMRLYVPLLGCVLFWMYEVGFSVSQMKATPGKFWLGFVIVDSQEEKLSLTLANARFFAKVFSGLLLGLGWLPIYGAKKVPLHDLMSHTQMSRMKSVF